MGALVAAPLCQEKVVTSPLPLPKHGFFFLFQLGILPVAPPLQQAEGKEDSPMVTTKVRRRKTKTAKGKAARPRANGKPKFQPLPDLPPDQFEILKNDIAENGLQYPVIQDEKGNTLDGHQRERALEELRIKSYPVKVIAGLTDEQKWHYALSVNVKRRNLTTAQKRALAEAELKRTPNLANNWLAEILGMDDKTVLAARKRLESTSEIPKLKKLRGKDGKQRASRYRQVVANTAAELKVARQIVNALPSSCNGKMLDTITAARLAPHRPPSRQDLREIGHYKVPTA